MDRSLLDDATGGTASQILVCLLLWLGLIHVNDAMIKVIVDEGVCNNIYMYIYIYIYTYIYHIHIAMIYLDGSPYIHIAMLYLDDSPT